MSKETRIELVMIELREIFKEARTQMNREMDELFEEVLTWTTR